MTGTIISEEKNQICPLSKNMKNLEILLRTLSISSVYLPILAFFNPFYDTIAYGIFISIVFIVCFAPIFSFPVGIKNNTILHVLFPVKTTSL